MLKNVKKIFLSVPLKSACLAVRALRVFKRESPFR